MTKRVESAETIRKRKKSKRVAHTVQYVLLHIAIAILVLFWLLFFALVMVCNTIFNGPSPTARNVLTMSMLESSGMKWCPGVFIGEEMVKQIQTSVSAALPDEISDASILIQAGDALYDDSGEWDDHPDGIRIEHLRGETYTAHVMIVRDPGRVYTATSYDVFSLSRPGKSIDVVMEAENAVAGVNGGAFNDDGSRGEHIGRLPQGLVVSRGEILWDDGRDRDGFVGFTEDNTMVVAKTIDKAQIEEMNIRDGCTFGPILIMNGTVNEEAYNTNSGYNPRTCIGQRADGAVIFLCIDGRQANSLGGTYADAIDIMVEYGAVNAFNLDGGSSAVMYYRDTAGLYGEAGALQMINNYSLLQESARLMPTFFLVAPEEDQG